MLKHALTALAVASMTVASFVVAPSTAHSAVNVYTTPGRHVVNGREWNTTCSPYSTGITRCRAEIKSGGKWLFNNLAYLAADRKLWGDNALARPSVVSSAGRDWVTSCNDDWTGESACRSFIKSGDKWVFNNIVYFAPGTVDYPKFTFDQSTGALTATATPSTRYWTTGAVSLFTSASGAATKGTVGSNVAVTVTQREIGDRTEVHHGGGFGWILTRSLTQQGSNPPATTKPTPVVPPPTSPVVSTPPAPPVVSVPSVVSSVGAVPVGSASYSVPSNAIFVTASGSRSGSGTLASPFGSLAYALEKAVSGSTIVMRGGVYRESTTVPFYKALTIQSYPKEAVWLDGSSVVTGWQRAGNAWVVAGWDHFFDHRVSHSEGVDQSASFVDPKYPMAGYPDQVWVSGARLRQVATVGAVVPGTFFVDEPGRRLFVGSDPTGKQVEASTRQQGMVIVGAGTTVRGIGVRRYANTFWMGGAISAQVDNITLENVVSSENATQGVDGWGKKMRFNRITLSDNGAIGLGLNKADDLVLSNSLIRSNNIESFKEQPVSGGVKIARSKRVMISGNSFDQNTTTGLWFDNWAQDITVVGNRFSGNGKSGLLLEALSRAVVADNYFVNNGTAGLYVVDANDISVWNNTFFANKAFSVRIFQDSRRSTDPVASLVVRDISLRNNVVSYGSGGSCPYLVDDTELKVSGQTMRVTSEGNAYHRVSSTSPANFVCWANGTSGRIGYMNLNQFRAGTGNDRQSTLTEGESILTSDYALTAKALASTTSVPLPIPAAVASAIGVAANTRTLGAVSPMIK